MSAHGGEGGGKRKMDQIWEQSIRDMSSLRLLISNASID